MSRSVCSRRSAVIQVSFGETHKVVGGHPSLGDWDVGSAPQMQWNDGNVWTLEVQLPEGKDIEFKVVTAQQTVCLLHKFGHSAAHHCMHQLAASPTAAFSCRYRKDPDSAGCKSAA